MNNNQNSGLNSRPYERRNDRGWCNFACIQNVFRNFSALCSFAGASLFGVIFFGLTDILNYRNTKLVYECAHYMVIAAVILFLLAFLLSFFKEDSKQNTPVVATQTNVRESMQFRNNRISSINTNTDKLKLAESYTKVKESAISENIKSADVSSKIFNFSSLNKQEKIASKALTLSSSCENFHADQAKQRETANTLPPNISSKTNNHPGTFKQGENTRTITPHTSSKKLQHASKSKQNESAIVLSPNISSKALQNSSTSDQCDIPKVLSLNVSSKMFQHASVPEQKARNLSAKPRSQSIGEKPSHFDRQLVPYEKHPKIPHYGQNLQTSPPYQAGNFYEFMSPNASGYSPVTEVTATKRMTIAPWGVTQEEYQIHQRTFYHVPRIPPVGGFAPQYGLRQSFKNDPNNVQEYQINQTTFYQSPPHLGGKISSCVQRSKLINDQNGISSSVSNQPRQNKVSDVLTRLESMNLFH